VRWHRRPRRQRAQDGQRVPVAERRLARGGPVQHGPQAEQVAPGIDGRAAGLLGGHVGGRADHGPRLGELGVRLAAAGQAEIDDPDPTPPLLQPHVRRLDVTVDQPPGVGRGQAVGDFPADAQHLGQRQPAAGPLQPLFERLAAEQLHGQERHAAVLADLIDGDDVLVLDGRGQPGLAQEAAVELGVGRQGRPHDLQGHRAAEVGVLGLEDDAHGADPQDLQDAVGTQAAQLVWLLRRRQEGVVRGRGQSGGVGQGRRRVLRGGAGIEGRLSGGPPGRGGGVGRGGTSGRGGAYDPATSGARSGPPGHALVHAERRTTVRTSEGNHVAVGVEGVGRA
jgi:hypothetical protein